MISYRDVAIVEPGESGSVFGDDNFWDYVTIEGSDDGDTWTHLLTPYDCRFDGNWQTAYNNGSDGNESMLRNHIIDLAGMYAAESNVYVRFRLLADANTNGWGWGIEDVEVTNSVSDISSEDLPVTTFELGQNYPNPFNPDTRIKYQVARQENVILIVYNTLGQQVKTLVNSKQEAGAYTVNFSGTELASGVYYYKLTAGSFVKMHKMILMK